MRRWTGEAVLALRKRLGFTQEEMARHVGVAFSTVNRWENDHAAPSRLACEKLTMLANGGGRGAGD